ncbi:MAG TPA: hypothetical protein VN723_06620 [Rhizomicrobium sp.]|jgi:hypothetical protein|nr:hypothetical protein [Rhizomicrobium sp.]
MRWTVAALLFAIIAAPTFAAEKEAGKEGDKAGAPGTNIDMPFLMAPMTDADGKLSGYAYISSRLTAASDASATLVRDKIAFIQDAFVRDVNKTEIAPSGVTVDNAALQARLLADARGVVGGGKIVSIAITQVQVAPLHPSPVTPAAVAPSAADSATTSPAKPATKP